MVVFTCGHCGESVQKPKVEKHYLTKCRNKIPNLSCMDCFKDFHGKEYEAHTKCITEEQRYSAKGFVAKTPKGEQKQNAWVEMITEVLNEQKGAAQSVIRIIQEVSKHTNTPRKKPKFVNFVNNVCGSKVNPKDIDAAWAFISVKLAALQKPNNNQQSIDNKGPNSSQKHDEKEKQAEDNGGTGQSSANGATGQSSTNGTTGQSSTNGTTGQSSTNGATGQSSCNGDATGTEKRKKKDRTSKKGGKQVDVAQKGEIRSECSEPTGNNLQRNEHGEKGNSKIQKKAEKSDNNGDNGDNSCLVNGNDPPKHETSKLNGVKKKSKKIVKITKPVDLVTSSLNSTVLLLNELESELQNAKIESASTGKEEKKQKKKDKKRNKQESDASIVEPDETVTCNKEINGLNDIKPLEEFVEVKKRKKSKSVKKETIEKPDSEKNVLKLDLNVKKDEAIKKPVEINANSEKIESNKAEKDANVNGSVNIEKKKEEVDIKSKKQLKEEKKKKKYEEELKKASQPFPETEPLIPGETVKKSKKRKNLESVDSTVDTTQTVKPKKTKSNEEIANLHDENVASETNVKKDKFCWDEFIVTSLKKRGNEMAFNRLHKKVLAAYTEVTGKEPNEKMVKRLGKKIISAPHVKIIKEKAVLQE